MFSEDYVIRLVRRLGDFLARIVGKRNSKDFEGAIAEAGKAWDELLGHPREIVEVVDTPTLASMLREPERMRLASRLLLEEGHAHTGKGDPGQAAGCYRRATELVLEARALDPSPEDEAALLELGRLISMNLLDERYRQG